MGTQSGARLSFDVCVDLAIERLTCRGLERRGSFEEWIEPRKLEAKGLWGRWTQRGLQRLGQRGRGARGISLAVGNHVVSKDANVTQAMFVADNGPNKFVSLIAAATTAHVKSERSSARFHLARHA